MGLQSSPMDLLKRIIKSDRDRFGVDTVGGELLNIEAVAMPGKGQQIKTGSLGDVMQESFRPR